jgi:hypothetical protein
MRRKHAAYCWSFLLAANSHTGTSGIPLDAAQDDLLRPVLRGERTRGLALLSQPSTHRDLLCSTKQTRSDVMHDPSLSPGIASEYDVGNGSGQSITSHPLHVAMSARWNHPCQGLRTRV